MITKSMATFYLVDLQCPQHWLFVLSLSIELGPFYLTLPQKANSSFSSWAGLSCSGKCPASWTILKWAWGTYIFLSVCAILSGVNRSQLPQHRWIGIYKAYDASFKSGIHLLYSFSASSLLYWKVLCILRLPFLCLKSRYMYSRESSSRRHWWRLHLLSTL